MANDDSPDVPATPPVFLTAEWRSLVMVNYAIDAALLEKYVPRGVELDLWEGEALISVVGFLFLKTRVLGMPMPFHQNFPEVNLRFYVRRRTAEGWRRGVVFVREIVPKLAIAAVARALYSEPFREVLAQKPRSAFVAEGSPILVRRGVRLT